MNDFRQRNKFGGGNKGDRRGGNSGKRDFNRSHFGGDRARTTELFQATCASCGKTCEVPFRPNGKKPVYCKECFDRQNGGDERTPSYRKEERREFRPERSFAQPDNGVQELKRQIQAMQVTLDHIVRLISTKTSSETVEPSKKKPRTKKTK